MLADLLADVGEEGEEEDSDYADGAEGGDGEAEEEEEDEQDDEEFTRNSISGLASQGLIDELHKTLEVCAAAGEVHIRKGEKTYAIPFDVNDGDANGKTALHCAILAGADKCGYFASLQATPEDPWTREARAHPAAMLDRPILSPLAPLPPGAATAAAAAASPHLECVRALLDARADPQRAFFGRTALHLAAAAAALPAASKFAADVTRLLLDARASLHAADSGGDTPLHYAAAARGESAEGFATALQAMLATPAAPAALRLRNGGGATPLHLALRGGMDLSGAAMLLARGAPCGAADVDGLCPLHLALARGEKARGIVRTLLEGKAAPEARDCYGRSAEEVAWAVGAEGVAALLRQGGAGRESCALGAPPLPTALLSHPSCLLHTAATGSLVQKLSMYDEAQIFNQPENASRLLVLLSPAGLLRTAPFDQLSWRTAPRAPMADLLRVHEYKYVAEIASRCEKLKASEQLRGKLDADTELTPYSFEAALHAAGAAVEATRAVCSAHQRTARNAFCATRPPGHHAGPSGAVGEQSAGFCLFSNAAIAAAYALHVHREVVGKVAVVDFDVHHGNGTEACVQAVVPTTWSESYATAAGTVNVSGTRYKPWLGVGDTSNVFFASIHGFGSEEEEVSSPFYPGSGGPDTNMEMPIIRNKPMPLKSSSASWRRAMMHSLLQPLSQFKPDLIVISAGFDAHAHDPLDAGGLHERDYEWMTSELVAIAETLCEGRLVSVLEGGYRVTGGFCASLARAVGAHVSAMQQTSLVGCQWNFADAAARLERVIGEEQAWEETRRASLEADGHTEGADAPAPLQENGAPARRGKRSRKAVDYEALQAELDGNPSGD